jgi:hypothetical protein
MPKDDKGTSGCAYYERLYCPYWGWVQDLDRDVPYLRACLILTCLIPGTEVFIKMMLFDPEVGPSSKGGTVAGRQGGGREINECYSETKENWSWGMLPGDQGRVTSLERLQWPIK